MWIETSLEVRYLKFDEVVTNNIFKKNIIDCQIYMRINMSSFIFLIFYVDDILLASNDFDLLTETKHMFFSYYDMKDLEEASFVFGIKIIRDTTNCVLLSQRAYIDRILKRFGIYTCFPINTPKVKDDKLSKSYCFRKRSKVNIMKKKPHSSIVSNLIYA